ncbi:unannotated protein [freshwater metagenome]|uniref:Unannotated protein n=1 Tax=freshwater metagenome TaxID=449393 RepID=A0A6J6G5Q5_9ZZZZ
MPPLVRALDGSARQNLSKSREASSLLKPRPKSRIPIATSFSLSVTKTFTVFPSLCSKALVIKFLRILSIRLGSASINIGSFEIFISNSGDLLGCK